MVSKRRLSKQIMGDVTEVGWGPSRTGKTEENFIVVTVKMGNVKSKDKAEEKLQNLRESLLGKKVVMFPQ